MTARGELGRLLCPNAVARLVAGLLAVLAMAGCASREPPPLAEGGQRAYELMPAAGQANAGQLEYLIGPLDVLSITVFQEKDLTIPEVPVDASGNIIFPLIGQLQVAGKSSAEVSAVIAQKLGERFLINPQVSVLIKTSVAQKVTVDGEVKEAGVYAIQGQTTLMQAVAMAKGVSSVANLGQVVIFRQIGATRYAAKFDLGAIQAGRAPDPQIRGDDIVLVGQSRSKAILRDAIALAPTLTTAFVAVTQLARY